MSANADKPWDGSAAKGLIRGREGRGRIGRDGESGVHDGENGLLLVAGLTIPK